MRFHLALLVAAPLASALTVLRRQANVPACASPCLETANIAPCEAGDTPCMCVNGNWLVEVSSCIYSSCTLEEGDAAVAAGVEWCKAAGIEPYTIYPECANTCVASPPASTCAMEDGACLCNDPNWIGPIVNCVKSACSGDDLKNAEIAGKAVCKAWGVDITPIVGA